MTTPERSLAQRRNALERANVVRTRRAELKRDLAAGRADPGDLIADPPEWLATAKVEVVLLALPRVGAGKARKALSRCAVAPAKTIGGLSDRQRAELVALLREGLLTGLVRAPTSDVERRRAIVEQRRANAEYLARLAASRAAHELRARPVRD